MLSEGESLAQSSPSPHPCLVLCELELFPAQVGVAGAGMGPALLVTAAVLLSAPPAWCSLPVSMVTRSPGSLWDHSLIPPSLSPSPACLPFSLLQPSTHLQTLRTLCPPPHPRQPWWEGGHTGSSTLGQTAPKPSSISNKPSPRAAGHRVFASPSSLGVFHFTLVSCYDISLGENKPYVSEK